MEKYRKFADEATGHNPFLKHPLNKPATSTKVLYFVWKCYLMTDFGFGVDASPNSCVGSARNHLCHTPVSRRSKNALHQIQVPLVGRIANGPLLSLLLFVIGFMSINVKGTKAYCSVKSGTLRQSDHIVQRIWCWWTVLHRLMDGWSVLCKEGLI